MQVFDVYTFHDFIGSPSHTATYDWGKEKRYVVSEASLTKYEDTLRGTLYRHHSSFDLRDEVQDMGYPITAVTMHKRNSGLPREHKTRMAHLGEFMGAEYAKAFLDFETTRVFPKRLNPNVDQSMKGADIIGLRALEQPAELLLGEAKCHTSFDTRAIKKAYKHLVDLHEKEASRLLRFMKEVLRLGEDKSALRNVDRHMAKGVPRSFFILSITESRPQNPFTCLEESHCYSELPRLMAIHIQIESLRDWLPRLFDGRVDEQH